MKTATIKDVERLVDSSESAGRLNRVELAAARWAARMVPLRIGLAAIGSGIKLDLGNGHVLVCTVEKAAAPAAANAAAEGAAA